MDKMPEHLAIIVDGNGRWAVARGKSRSAGHRAGVNNLRKIVKHAFKRGIKVLSLYVFSTENFKRSKEEVDFLMNLFATQFRLDAQKYNKDGIKVVFSGRRDKLPQSVIDTMEYTTNLTKDNKEGIINFCLNYGGHAEIVDATKKVVNDCLKGTLNVEDINEEIFPQYLYQELPPVDLMIRTSGESRISNFLLWQLSYAEFDFVKIPFPDFNEKEFDLAMVRFNNRDRRFGGINYERKNN